MLEALHDPRYTYAALFHHLLVVVAQYIPQYGHDIADGREGFVRDVTTAVGGSGDCSSLSTSREEVEIRETGSQSAFADDGRGEFGRDFL